MYNDKRLQFFPRKQDRNHIITMTSTSQLAIGLRINKGNLKAAWLKYNHDTGYDIQVVQNMETPKSRYFSVCYSAPKTGWKKATGTCRAHVIAVGETSDDLSISSLNLTHTCERDGENRRKRNYRTKDICEVSNVLKVYQPALAGNSKQFATMAKRATGVSMKNGQSHLAVKAHSNDKIECHIGQYLWIPSLLSAYKDSDPDGSFAMDYTDCDWNARCKS
jgi:hypothetical protein